MYRIKAFGEYNALSNNNPDKVNKLGELSLYSGTFATDRGIFSDPAKPNSTLIVFSSLQEVSAVESVTVAVPPSVSSLILEMMENLIGKASAGDFGDAEAVVRDYIMTFWQGTVQNVVVNTMVTDGNRWLPSSIVFEGTSTTNPFQAQVWFSDDNFKNEYDLYLNRVAMPVTSLDSFFDSATAVQAILTNQLDIASIMAKVSLVAAGQPYTDAITTFFDWVDPTNNSTRIGIPWTVVNYGEAGRNIDSIRADLAAYILANTAYTEDQWTKLFPDIFGSNEFIFVPFYNHIAIPDDAVNSGVYSPGGNIEMQKAVAKTMIRGAGYDDAYMSANLNLVASVYKSIQLGVIGGYRNKDGVNQFGDRWKDYIAVGTNSIDFRRMSDKTQQFILTLNTMLAIAETMTAVSSVPRGYLRLVRNEILYVTATFDKVSLIVVSRNSLLEKYQAAQGTKPVPVVAS